MDTVNFKKLYNFNTFMFETNQDLEFNNGYLFYCASDFALPNSYQVYSFYSEYQFIHVYNVKFDKDKKPNKNFGRLVARFMIKGLGEIESISFRNGFIYFAFNYRQYRFYKLEYSKFAKETKKDLDK